MEDVVDYEEEILANQYKKKNIREQKRINRYKNYQTGRRDYQTTRRGNQARRQQGRGRGSRYNNRNNRKFRGATRRGRARYRNTRGRGRNRRSYGRRGNYANNIVDRNDKGNNNTKGRTSWKDKLPKGKSINQNTKTGYSSSYNRNDCLQLVIGTTQTN